MQFLEPTPMAARRRRSQAGDPPARAPVTTRPT